MSEVTLTEEFLQQLPRLSPEETFCFSCHAGLDCFNRCCADLNLLLTPYDVLRLRQSLDLPSREFIERFARVGIRSSDGFPQIHLKMRDEENRSCPFVTDEGCYVYTHRPGACRTYPIGRGASVDESGEIRLRYILIREPFCIGFEQHETWNVHRWISAQGLSEYNRVNDEYLKLMSFAQMSGQKLTKEQFQVVFLALYRLDEFPRFIIHHRLFEHMSVPQEIQSSILESESERLEFSINWIASLLRLHKHNNMQR